MRWLCLVLIGALAACAPREDASQPATVPAEALAAVDTASLMRHVRDLAHDSMLGRAPGSVGEDRTVAYLEGQFRALGLSPGNTDGSYIQAVPLVAMTADPAMTLTISGSGAPKRLRYREGFVAWTRHVVPSVSVSNAPLVFVGYGVEAPEFSWDDFKGEDMAGKVLVMLVNDPPLSDSSQFGGKAMTYYGRWTYKYEQGMKHKAAGVLLIHETGPAGYPWPVVQGMGGEKFDLATADSNRTRAPMEGWLHLDQARAILAAAGQDFDSLKARAATREFRPVPLGVNGSITIRNAIRSVASRNVLARLEGSDSAGRDEHIVYTAHWDHFGVGEPVNGDSIYNGADDKASGTAALLEVARALAELPVAPRRSVLFLHVSGEEHGLLGSQWFSDNSTVPLDRIVANVNVDMIARNSPDSIVVIGKNYSSLGDVVDAAGAGHPELGLVVSDDLWPAERFFYRSDHYHFARKEIPALFFFAGVHADYHEPSDTADLIDADKAARVARLIFYTVQDIANSDERPVWDPDGLAEVRLMTR
jgi:Zn-dependent M28 family amino/carboxypeptidase